MNVGSNQSLYSFQLVEFFHKDNKGLCKGLNGFFQKRGSIF